MTERGRRIRVNLAVAGATVLLLLLGVEAGVRLLTGDRFAPRPIFYDRHPSLGWAPSPMLDHTFHGSDFSMAIRTDEHGYRLGSRGTIGPQEPVVVLVGDSFTFGWGVSTGETFASYLDEALAPQGVRVVNLGVGGYGTLALAERFATFLESRDPATVRSVVVLHVHNDMTDDVNHALYLGGFREPRLNEQFRPRSAWRSWNWAEFVLRSREAPPDAPPPPDRDEDVLFRFPLRPTGKTSGPVPVDGVRTVAYEDLDLAVEADPLGALRYGAFTPLQAELLAVAVERMHCAAAGLPFHHAVVSHAPDWFVEGVGRGVATADACAGRVVFHGRVPLDRDLTETMMNAHSGRHFSPELNRLYAEILQRWIEPDLAG